MPDQAAVAMDGTVVAMKAMPGGDRGSPELQGVHERPILSVEGLRATIDAGYRQVEVLRDVTFDLHPNSTLGLIGPSGAGKTSVALAILGLLPGGQDSIAAGSIRLSGRDLTGLGESEYRQIRGRRIGMIFQDPQTALTPVHRIGRLIGETLRAHFNWSSERVRDRTRELLGDVGFSDPERVANAFPLELSGGMQQRVAIALALAADPAVLIADEPTSALDAIATAEILDLLRRLREEREISVLLISHEPEVVARMADRTVRIENGRMGRRPVTTDSAVGASTKAQRSTRAKVSAPPHPGLPSAAPVLEVRDLTAGYPDRSAEPVVTGVGFSVAAGEILGMVGQSGSGKTTVARCVLRLMTPSEGEIRLSGTDIATLDERQLRPFRPLVSAVFQNPGSSLNPRHRIGRIVEAPLIGSGVRDRSERRARVAWALDAVDLAPELAGRRPGELSGGQQQRAALARALVSEPRVLVCDEPFTSLDLPLRDRLVELLVDIQERRGLACLFIAHDLDVIARIAHRVAVMKDGRIIESGPAREVIDRPSQPFTQRLVRSGT